MIYRRITLIFLSLIVLAAFNPVKLQHPPIPAEHPDTKKVAIVLTEHPPTEQEITRQLSKFEKIKLRTIYKHVLNGYSVEGPLAELNRLKGSDTVMHVSEVVTYKVEDIPKVDIEPVKVHPRSKNHDEKPNNSHQKKPLHTPSRFRSFEALTDPFEWIGSVAVRGIRDKNGNRLSGKGVTIGVIDTGIDYRHTDLRKNYAGGYDFIDHDEDPMETNQFGFERTIHGTHVAGVIAANGRMRGIAPDAKIIAYRALGPGGTGTSEQVLAAIDKAVEEKVDILNLSLGNNVNGPDLPISLALNKAVEKGVIAITSSGNSGPDRWTVGSPGTASKAIAVGASTPPMKVPFATIPGQAEKVRLELLQGSDKWKLTQSRQIVFAGLGTKKEMVDVDKKLVLVERGKVSFTEKAKNAAEAGAAGVIIFNNTKGNFFGNLEENISIPVAAISKNDGLALKKQINRGLNLIRIELKEEMDVLADFSSRGPVTGTWEIKPDIVAPGVAINSTVPGGYLSLQGTSMAAPHVAGACALIKQAHPDWGPAEIKAAIMNTAKMLTNHRGKLYRTFEQGAGRIDVMKAVKTETLVMPGSLQFGKFQLKEDRHLHKATVKIRNTSSRKKSYHFLMPAKESGIEWELPLSFELRPNEMRRVDISMKASPEELTNGIKDGRLVLSDGRAVINIPYLYVLEEPDYPRVMGFDFAPADNGKAYRYEVYLPGGAEEFGIALFDPDSYRFAGYLDWGRKLGKGVYEKEIPADQLPAEGMYIAKIFARKAGRENTIEAVISIIKRSDLILDGRR